MPKLPAAFRKPQKPGERANGARGNGAGANGEDEKLGTVVADRGKEGAVDVVGWVDERTGASPFLTGMLLRKVPKGTNWFYTLGSATLFAFAMQALTGVFLAMYYVPSATEAYASIQHVTNDVFLGEFVRGLHKWGATVMIILIFLHMGRTFFFGAYKYPRELNWVIGVVLLILTLVMGLTGYLLPFDQRSYWATIVAMNITASGPMVGPYLADFLRAGSEFTATTLPRFYAVHMLLVPGLIIALIVAHLYLVVKLGTTAPPWVRADPKPKSLREEEVGMNNAQKEAYLREYEILKKKGKPFFPYAIFKDSAMMMVVAGVIVVMSLVLGAELGPKADPTTTTYVPRPEWYFFFLFELLRVIKPPELVPIATIGIPTICMVLLLLLPFYDRNPERRPDRRPVATTAGILTIVAMAYLTFLGASAGSPTEIELEVPPQYEKGKQVAAQSGCLACHKFGENGNDGPGPELTEIGGQLPAQAIARSLEVGPDVMPAYGDLPREKFEALVDFLASLQ